jgi:hypothetical protein
MGRRLWGTLIAIWLLFALAITGMIVIGLVVSLLR